jgi:hypothetical protein
MFYLFRKIQRINLSRLEIVENTLIRIKIRENLFICCGYCRK